jgi:hypothetical protein
MLDVSDVNAIRAKRSHYLPTVLTQAQVWLNSAEQSPTPLSLTIPESDIRFL